MSLKNLLRETLIPLETYAAGKPIDEVRREYALTGRIAKLASNENPLGTSPRALEAMRKAVEEVFLYPDDDAHHFRNKIADLYGVGRENVFAASGSVEIIELAGYAFLNPGDVVVTSERTFAMYYITATRAGAVLKLSPMTDGGYRYNLGAMAELIDDGTKIVYLANPTNPTGTWFTGAEFDKFMSRVPEDVLVVYDDAYKEYLMADDMPDAMKHYRDGRRVMLMRTFSKAYGLAGIRAGYGVAPKEIIDGLMKCRAPFNMNSVAQAGAIAALDDHEFVARSKEYNRRELEFLRKGLEDLPVTVPPSRTNFLMIDTEKDALWLFEELKKIGVIVRPLGGYNLPGAVRVNTGLREDDEKFLKHFRRLILSEGG